LGWPPPPDWIVVTNDLGKNPGVVFLKICKKTQKSFVFFSFLAVIFHPLFGLWGWVDLFLGVVFSVWGKKLGLFFAVGPRSTFYAVVYLKDYFFSAWRWGCTALGYREMAWKGVVFFCLMDQWKFSFFNLFFGWVCCFALFSKTNKKKTPKKKTTQKTPPVCPTNGLFVGWGGVLSWEGLRNFGVGGCGVGALPFFFLTPGFFWSRGTNICFPPFVVFYTSVGFGVQLPWCVFQNFFGPP